MLVKYLNNKLDWSNENNDDNFDEKDNINVSKSRNTN